MSENEQQPPLQTVRDGSVNIKLWRQDSKRGPFVTASIGNTYKDRKTGEYGESRSFSATDILKLQVLLPEAHGQMALWRDYFRKLDREENPSLSEKPKSVIERDAVLSKPEAELQNMAAKRDAVMSNAAPKQSEPSAGKGVTREAPREPDAR